MDVRDRLERAYDELDADRLQTEHYRASLFDAANLSPHESWVDNSLEICPDVWQAVTEDDAARYRDILSIATREQTQRACELRDYLDRSIDTLVLDIDETLRSATENGNRISPQACYLVREFHDRGGSIIVCTGKSIGYVRGCLTQALGQEILTSGRFSIVYEAGAGVYTPSAGSATKQRLYNHIDNEIQDVFDQVQTNYLERIPDGLCDRHHFEQKEFNVTLIPNADVKSDTAIETIDRASSHLVAAVADVIATKTSHSRQEVTRFFAAADPELASALAQQHATLAMSDGAEPNVGFEGTIDADGISPEPLLQSIDIGYYQGDAVELTSGTLGKANGVRVAADTLSLEDPFMLVMGDSKTDLEVMEAITETNSGICAAPDHASAAVLEHCNEVNGIIFDQGDIAEALQIAIAYNLLDEL